MNRQENTVTNMLNSVLFKQLSKKEMTHHLGGALEKDDEEVKIETAEGEGEEEGME